MSLLPDGVIMKRKLIETKASWGAFCDFIETENHFILLVDKFIGFPIPKRDLTEPGLIDKVRTILDDNIKRQAA
jgi:hypothetical protein